MAKNIRANLVAPQGIVDDPEPEPISQPAIAGKGSFFLVGANAKIILNNKSVAYATDVSFSVKVRHASPRVLGRFEVETIQPLTYDVEGSLTIIRYGRGLKAFHEATGSVAPSNVSNQGNSIGSFGRQGLNLGQLGLPDSSGQFDGRADDAFNPAKFFQSQMFNIEIRQKLKSSSIDRIRHVQLGKKIGDEETTVIMLRDCRLLDMQFKLNKKSVAVQVYTFKARYMDDDTFIARKSGVGQELT